MSYSNFSESPRGARSQSPQGIILRVVVVNLPGYHSAWSQSPRGIIPVVRILFKGTVQRYFRPPVFLSFELAWAIHNWLKYFRFRRVN